MPQTFSVIVRSAVLKHSIGDQRKEDEIECRLNGLCVCSCPSTVDRVAGELGGRLSTNFLWDHVF